MPDKKNIQLWNEFVQDTYALVRSFGPPKIPADSELFAVIVEPRKHPHLEYVLRNVMHFLGSGWGLQIFTGTKNTAFVHDLVRGWGSVHVYQLSVDNLDHMGYNSLKKSYEFWKTVKGDHQLCFETDSILCRRGVEEFLPYDYIGAPWARRFAVSDRCRIGNGGLSLRRKEAMLDVIRTSNTHHLIMPLEDVFFSVNLSLNRDKYSLPTIDVARTFSVESIYYATPFGIHKPWSHLGADEVLKLLASVNYES